jgi:hypothetical protein
VLALRKDRLALRAPAVPWNAFSLDPREWRDTDGDGIGDHADTDVDGDGWSHAEEKEAGTDPLNRLRFPRVSRSGQSVTGSGGLAEASGSRGA